MRKLVTYLLAAASLAMFGYCFTNVPTDIASATIVQTSTSYCEEGWNECETTTTVEQPCTTAHPCTTPDCLETHGPLDCAPPETTTTTPPGPHGCGVAGKDGEPGNDDCATTSTSRTSTPPPTTSTTPTTTTTPVTTTTETTPGETGSVPPPKVKTKTKTAAKRQQARAAGELPFTGLPPWAPLLAVILGVAAIGTGLKLKLQRS